MRYPQIRCRRIYEENTALVLFTGDLEKANLRNPQLLLFDEAVYRFLV